MKNEEEVVVAVSGYFNPIHRGHIELLKAASELGTKLVVIINNDIQVKIKNSVPFMDEQERAYIVKNISCVDEVFISKDTDKTVCRSLEYIAPDIFAARRVVPPDLIAPAARSPMRRKDISPDDFPPPERGSASPRSLEKFVPVPDPYLHNRASRTHKSMIPPSLTRSSETD